MTGEFYANGIEIKDLESTRLAYLPLKFARFDSASVWCSVS